MPNVIDEINKKNEQQLHSIPAKRLIEKLIPLKSKVESTTKRWFWELLQNASDYNEIVDVKLEVDDKNVVFRHNGKPFSIDDVLNIISPDSGKDKDELQKDNIGKFGSGLVSTHILSSEIKVDGAYWSEHESKLFKFEVILDRKEYENKDKLIESIEKSKNKLLENPEAIKETEYKGFMTSFSYNLQKSLPGLSNANVVTLGLEYIYKILPYTLCFMSKVQSVEINDNRSNASIHRYSIKRHSLSDNIQKFAIDTDKSSNVIEFVKFAHNQVESAFRYENDAVLPLPKNITKLFCGLPLIGSENIGLPFILNSLDFEPTIEREGVEITPNDDKNISLFKDSTNLYKLILDYISTNKLKNAFHLTKLNKEYNGVEGSKHIFRRDYVPLYKGLVNNSKVVKNEKGEFIAFSEMLLPFDESKISTALYACAKELKPNKLPSSDSYEGWFEAIDFNVFPEQKYNLMQFLSDVSKTEQIKAFVLHSDISVIDWLKSIASLVNEKEDTLFSRYAVLPNQLGTLKKREDLKVDDDIPAELKKIYNQLSNTEIEENLLDNNFADFENVISTHWDISYICRQIDDSLKSKYSEDNGSTAKFIKPLNELYSWIDNSKKTKTDLERLFPWFYTKRATLFMDTFNEAEREQALTIAQSGKMKALANLAKSALTIEELGVLSEYANKLPEILMLLQEQVDDITHADSDSGDVGEELVYKDLSSKYPKSKGYEIIWSAKDGEPRFDFEIKIKGKTIFYVDAKTTKRGIDNSNSIPFFVRNAQWNFLPTKSPETRYLIARIFRSTPIVIKYLDINLVEKHPIIQ